jgi:hypothetical protein
MNVGETVTVKVRNPLWANSTAYMSGIIAETNTYTGTVLPSPKWFGEDKLCLSTGIAEFPFRIIAKEDIINLSNTKAPEGALQTLWTISGNKGSSYLVTRDGSRWSCNCLGYSYRRKCTHIDTAKADYSSKNNLLPRSNFALLSPKSEVSYMGNVETGDSPKLNNVRGEKMAKSETKTQIAIRVMKANINKPMAQVIPLLMKECDLSEKNARVCYTLRVKADPSIGKLEVRAKTAKVKVEKSVREKKAIEKSIDEIAAIKAKNLQTMKVATLKGHGKEAVLPAGRVARPQGEGVADFDPQLAREEVQAILNDQGLDAHSLKFMRGRQ